MDASTMTALAMRMKEQQKGSPARRKAKRGAGGFEPARPRGATTPTKRVGMAREPVKRGVGMLAKGGMPGRPGGFQKMMPMPSQMTAAMGGAAKRPTTPPPGLTKKAPTVAAKKTQS